MSLPWEVLQSLFSSSILKLTLVHSPSSRSLPFFVVVFSIFLDSSLHISDWAYGPSRCLAFLKALFMAWSQLAKVLQISILSTEANLGSYCISAILATFLLSHALQGFFFSFLS